MPFRLKPWVVTEVLRCWYSLKGCGKGLLHHRAIWGRTIVFVSGSCVFCKESPAAFLLEKLLSYLSSLINFCVRLQAGQPFLSIFCYSNKRGSKEFWHSLSRQNWQDLGRAPTNLPKPSSLALRISRGPELSFHGCHKTEWSSSQLWVPLTTVLSWVYMFPFIHILSVYIYMLSIYSRNRCIVRSWS